MSELDDMAHLLEKITRDPLADAVPGRVTVLQASEPTGRARYQECALELEVAAPGVSGVIAHTAVVTTRAHWPRVGQVLPARVSPTRPDVPEVDWDALATR